SLDCFGGFFGILYAGAVPVPIYPPMRMSQLEDYLRRQAGILRNAGARILINMPEGLRLAGLLRGQVESLSKVESIPSLAAEPPELQLPLVTDRSIAMIIGVPKEIKADEYRVGLIPSTTGELVTQGHNVAVETCAGEGAGIGDDEYIAAGARIAATADEIFKQSELIVKVKEPLASERMKLRRGQIIFTYLHLAPDPEQTYDLLKSGVTAIAYETVTDAAGKLPLLSPMSKVAGRMAPQVAAHYLERPYGGRGILLSGVDDVPSAKVVVIGGGVVGQNAAEIAIVMGAEVTVVARSAETRHSLSQLFQERIRIVGASRDTIEALCKSAHVVIAAALVAGATAPKLISAG